MPLLSSVDCRKSSLFTLLHLHPIHSLWLRTNNVGTVVTGNKMYVETCRDFVQTYTCFGGGEKYCRTEKIINTQVKALCVRATKRATRTGDKVF